uniref:NET domain-containing protein n=1 Tax=viral metagenome TaxID=1070528 RepID=A0A6C0HY01_9ZZZZ
MTTTHTPDLNQLKTKIESITKMHQIEVLKIITSCSNVTVNENKSGVYINLSYMEPTVIEEIEKYLTFVEEQEQILNPAETEKEDIKNTFFSNKEGINENDDEILTVYR